MSTKGSAATLTQAAKELAIEWQETKAHWHDVKSMEFEQKYLEELPFRISRAIAVMGEIDTLLRKVRHDWE